MLVLRACNEDMTAYGGFQWPKSGHVQCPDWIGNTRCGNGLHGLPWGVGNCSAIAGYINRNAGKTNWLVVDVIDSLVVMLENGMKCKFPTGNVIYCGDLLGATDYLLANGAAGKAVYGATIKVKDNESGIAGNRSTLTGGHGSTLTGGHGSTLTGGHGSTLTIQFFDRVKDRYRIKTAEVGEDGILPNVKYKLSEAGLFVPVNPPNVVVPAQQVATVDLAGQTFKFHGPVTIGPIASAV